MVEATVEFLGEKLRVSSASACTTVGAGASAIGAAGRSLTVCSNLSATTRKNYYMETS